MEDLRLEMWLIRETDGAIFVADAMSDFERSYWIPRSLVSYMKKTGIGRNHVSIEFCLPEWKVQQADLWDFVQ